MKPIKTTAYQVITDKILALLDLGVVPWQKPFINGSPVNMISKKEYRGINSILLNCTPYGSQYWLTFNQAKGKGGQIKKGEHGFPVIYWHMFENKDKATGEIKTVPFLRYYTVFNVEQCEGIETPSSNTLETELNDDSREICKRVFDGMPNKPQMATGHKACYSPSTDTVTMPALTQFKSEDAYYSTQYHELIHSTGHKDRLNRSSVTDNHGFGSGVYGKEELIAEFGSSFLCASVNIVNAIIDNSAAYIASWKKTIKADDKLVVQAAGAASKAAAYILGT